MLSRQHRGQSASLNHLRWIAAFLVVAQHARGFLMVEYYPDAGLLTKLFYFATGFSHSAVMVFFVLSGFLVGGKALKLLIDGADEEERDRFMADRATRIMIVLWPALLLSAVIALVAPATPVLTTENWAGPGPAVVQLTGVAEWIGTPLLLNETVTSTVGFNGPLWSLAFEWTYYVIATGVLCSVARDRRPTDLAVCGYMLLLLVLCVTTRPLILILFLCWLMGAAAARVRRGAPIWLSLPLFIAALIFARVQSQTIVLDLIVSASTALLLTTRRIRELQLLPGVGKRMADFSFSLYATHVPVMLALVSAAQANGVFLERQQSSVESYMGVVLLVGLSYLVAFVFSCVTEQRTEKVRDWLLSRYKGRYAGRAESPVSSSRS